ncbi:lamin-A-like [Pagrus major]|uniref:lamin-A-like n=1 Tax=Pagrus major TaxID=143350 RepID=UPI003CC8A499
MMNTDLQSLMKDLESNTLEVTFRADSHCPQDLKQHITTVLSVSAKSSTSRFQRSQSVSNQSSSSLSGSNRTTQVQSDAVQPVSLSQWPEMLRQKFQEKLQMKIRERESEEQNSSSSVRQSSTTEPTVGVKFDPWGKYIQLINTSTEDQQLGGWALQIQVNDNKPIKHTFKDSSNLKAGKVFTVGCNDYRSPHCLADLVLKDLRFWSNADKVQVSLISNTGKIQYNLDRKY